MDDKEKIKQQDHWDEVEFLNEMQSRVDDYESGRVKGILWEEFKAKIRNRSKMNLLIVKPYCRHCGTHQHSNIRSSPPPLGSSRVAHIPRLLACFSCSGGETPLNN
jgi:predicted Zn-ribbon and HTH transcriptional regulator